MGGEGGYLEMVMVATLGASNAGKTAAALEEAGVSAVRLGRVGWRPTTESVKAVIEEMDLELAGSEVLILQCMDNNSFFVLDEETGSMTLPSMGENNIYHVAGPLVVAKDQPAEQAGPDYGVEARDAYHFDHTMV
jgi:hypothetical protein